MHRNTCHARGPKRLIVKDEGVVEFESVIVVRKLAAPQPLRAPLSRHFHRRWLAAVSWSARLATGPLLVDGA